MNPIILLVVAAGAALLLLGGKRSAEPTIVTLTGFAGPTSQALPIRVPASITSQPASDSGSQREDEDGRTWGTFYINRDERKHYELLVLKVAEDAGNSDIGNGEVIADVYQTVVASADWEWNGQSCGARRFRLTFRQGHLQKSELLTAASADKPAPSCQTVRPLSEVFREKLSWVQRGPDIFLVVDTDSGANKLSPESIASTYQTSPLPKGRFGSRSNAQWYNGFVASAYFTVDVSWIFNPTDAQGNPL